MDERLAEQYWRWWHDRTEETEKAAEQRTRETIQAIRDAAKIQADAMLRGQQEVAAALRDLADAIRRSR